MIKCITLLILTLSINSYAQNIGAGQPIYVVSTLPVSCAQGQVVVKSTTPASLSFCDATNNWITFGSPTPTGTIIATLTTCGVGWTEATELNGKTLVGTLAANGNVGTTGSSDSIIPTGTVTAPTFTGTVNTLAVTAHTSVATKQGTAAGNVITTGTHTITGIPGGTNSIPVFTGNAFDPHPTFTRVIFCKKS